MRRALWLGEQLLERPPGFLGKPHILCANEGCHGKGSLSFLSLPFHPDASSLFAKDSADTGQLSAAFWGKDSRSVCIWQA